MPVGLIQERYRMQSKQMERYIYKQIENGLNELTKDHYQTGFLLRNMKHEKTIEINETWFRHIEECGIECQVSMFFVKQLFPNCFYMTTMLTKMW